jgi:methyl-accepting chemotaxis protein
MEAFNNMKIGTKLGLGFAIVLILMGIMGISALTQMSKVNDQSTEITTNWLPATRFIMDLNTNTSDFRIAELAHIIATNEAEMQQLEAVMQKVSETIESNKKAYQALIASPEEQNLFDQFVKQYEAYRQVHDKVLQLSRQLKTEEAMVLINGESQKLFDASSATAVQLVELNVAGADAASKLGDAIYASAQQLVTIIMMISLILGGLIAFFIVKNLLRQLGGEPSYAANVVAAVSAGDLTVQVQLKKGDDHSMLAGIAQMVVKLSSIVGEVRSAADNLSSASEEVSSTAQTMSQATSEQAASVEETSASVEEMSASVGQNAENAKVTESIASKAAQLAGEGGQAVGQTVTAMKSIANKISIIDDIAYQTNLLALNAAIEAARAGTHGRGFAVVAAEVRKLAERSQIAAQEISEVARNSVGLAEKAGSLLTEIVPGILRTSELVQEISAASDEQSSGATQINIAMTQLNQITQQNAASSEELAATAEEMSGQAEQLQELIGFFKVGPTAAGTAKAYHY